MTAAERVRAEWQAVEPVETFWIQRAEAQQLQLTKPPGSLGRLEEIANRICAIQKTLAPVVRRPSIYVFAADHGVCAEGVNPYPQEVTAQMVVNFLSGGAAINVLARVVRCVAECDRCGRGRRDPSMRWFDQQTRRRRYKEFLL